MKSVIYKITYLPHEENGLDPKYYIGSKHNYKGNYLGSLSSKQRDWFTGSITLKEWWKNQTQNEPDNFKFEILKTYLKVSPKKLVECELQYQQKIGILGEEYFNKGYATKGFVSGKKTKITRQVLSQKTKRYWDSPDGLEKRKD